MFSWKAAHVLESTSTDAMNETLMYRIFPKKPVDRMMESYGLNFSEFHFY